MKKSFEFRKFTFLYSQLLHRLCYTFPLHKNDGYYLSGSCSSIDFFNEYYEVLKSLWKFRDTHVSWRLYLLQGTWIVWRRRFDSWLIHDFWDAQKIMVMFFPQIILASRHLVSFSIPESAIRIDMRHNFSSLKVYQVIKRFWWVKVVGRKTEFIRARPSFHGKIVAPLLQPILEICFDNNVSNRKRSIYLKGYFKTSSK